jgi:polyisoprenoid-binding protein YceI
MSVVEQAVPTGTWTVDPVHSSVDFKIRHIGLSNFKGRFDDFSATLTDGHLDGSARVESVITKVPDLHGHLQSPDFFDAERHPEITFSADAIEVDGGVAVVNGELTIKGVTKPIEARGSITEPGLNGGGADAIGLELEAKVNRHDFGVSWNADLPNGKKALGDEVTLTVELELVRNP